MTCEEARLSLGAYTLGALDPSEEAEVRAHLEECASCQEEMRALEGLPALLADLTIEEASGELQPSPALYESLRERAAAEDAAERDSRHRWLAPLAAAAVLVIAIGGGVLGWHQLNPGPKTFSHSQGAIHLAVQLKTQSTGTSLSVRVRGLPAHEHCQLLAIGAGGVREDAGWWIADYEGEAVVTGTTSFTIPQLSEIRVVDPAGKLLVNVKV